MNYKEKATKNLSERERDYFNYKFAKESKSDVTAYIVWAFLGAFGGHRFYLRHYGTGLILLALTTFTLGVGAIAGWYDVVNIKRLTEKENKELILRLVKEAKRK